MATNQIAGIALLVLGLALLFFGWQASQSVADQISETFTGNFTDSTMWFIIGGAIAAAVGAFLLVRK